MGLLILFILDCVVAFILVLIYTFIMKNYYKRNNSHFSFFSVFAWSIFLFFLCHLLLPWIFSVSSWLLPFIPFAVIFFISFHNTFRVIRHYKIFLLMFLFFLLSLYYLISAKQEKDWLYAEKFFSKNFPDESYAHPQPLDKKYFHFITRDEMKFQHHIYDKEFFDLKTGRINSILVPNIVNLQNAFFNFEENTVHLNSKAYTLKDNEIYILKCRDLFNDKKLQNLFKGKKVLCMAEYRKFPREGMQEGRKYQNIIARYAPQNLPSKSGFMLKFLLNVRPYMYNGEAEVLEKDVLFADTVFLYQPPNQFIGEYYNPKLKRKNFCPVSIAYYAGKCIEFRKLFVPIGSKDENT